MKLPRFSVRSLTYLVLIIAVDCGWALQIGRLRSIFGFGEHYLELPLLGLFNILAVAGYPLLARRANRPFLVGFVGGGLLLAADYVILFRQYPMLGWHAAQFAGPVEEAIMLPVFYPHNPGYTPRFFALLAVLAVLGTIPLAVFSTLFGLLNWLVARGKLPWLVALTIAALLIASTVLEMRSLEYGRISIYYEEVDAAISSEVDALSKRLEILESMENPPRALLEEEINSLQGLDKRDQALAKVRRQLEKCRRSAKYPWLGVEE